MGVSSRLSFHARDRDGSDRADDRVEAARVERGRRSGPLAGLTAVALALATSAGAESIRIGFFATELERDGPGLLLRDILSGEDADILAVSGVVAKVQPDILVISGFDYDQGLAALSHFRDLLSGAGPSYPHLSATLPNSGLDTALDLDRDGRKRGARDAQGFGTFAGQGGIAILSRFPVLGAGDFNDLLWRDLPGASIAEDDPARDEQRLSSVGHISVTLDAPGGPLTVLAFHATPPVFDGPEDRNGRRNHDEAAFWLHYLDGAFGPPPTGKFVLLGDANADPADGDGRPEAITALLRHPLLTDPEPQSAEAEAAAGRDGGANLLHEGDPALDTANWRDGPKDPGNLRVDYILPSRDLVTEAAGVAWGHGEAAPRHGLVWVDIAIAP